MTKLKGAYISVIIGRRGFGCEDNLHKIMCPKSFAGFRFDLGPLFKRSNVVLHTYHGLPISPLLLVIEVLNVKTTYRKSCAPNLLVGSDLTLDPSFKVECGP